MALLECDFFPVGLAALDRKWTDGNFFWTNQGDCQTWICRGLGRPRWRTTPCGAELAFVGRFFRFVDSRWRRPLIRLQRMAPAISIGRKRWLRSMAQRSPRLRHVPAIFRKLGVK